MAYENKEVCQVQLEPTRHQGLSWLIDLEPEEVVAQQGGVEWGVQGNSGGRWDEHERVPEARGALSEEQSRETWLGHQKSPSRQAVS